MFEWGVPLQQAEDGSEVRRAVTLHAVHKGSARTEWLRPTLNAILQLRCAGLACAVDTAEDFFNRFNAVSDDTAVTVRTDRRKRVDCALETVESVTFSAHDYFKRLVIFVFANFACRHTQFVRARGD